MEDILNDGERLAGVSAPSTWLMPWVMSWSAIRGVHRSGLINVQLSVVFSDGGLQPIQIAVLVLDVEYPATLLLSFALVQKLPLTKLLYLLSLASLTGQ